MPKETSKKKLLPFENADVAKVVAGSSIGAVTPFILREYVDSYAPGGVLPGILPIEWGRPSVIGSIGLGIGCLVGGIVSKSLRLFLLPLGITSTSIGIMMGLFPTPPSSAVRLVQTSPAGLQQKQRAPGNIVLRSAGSPSKPGSNFMQKSPQQRLVELKREADADKLKAEVEKLEEEQKFRREGNHGIPLRT